jgi:D-sedoheptulose 7-phosphate isomerase
MADIRQKITSGLAESEKVHSQIAASTIICDQLVDLSERCLSSLRNSGKIIFAGNGGSFADSQHLAAELISRLQFDRAPLPSVALGTNSSSTTAIGNDYGYEYIFARELQVIGNENDVFIPISTSGNSKNILSAIDIATDKGLHVCGLTGEIGGQLATKCESIKIPSRRTERIQEGHILVGHVLCGLIEDGYFSKS